MCKKKKNKKNKCVITFGDQNALFLAVLQFVLYNGRIYYEINVHFFIIHMSKHYNKNTFDFKTNIGFN